MSVKQVYLDHSATTPVRPEVAQAMLPYLTEVAGNASSLHLFGQRAKRALEEAREDVASALGVSPLEVFFTSGGTESDNLAVFGVAQASRDKGRHLITSQIEHHAILLACEWLEAQGYEVTYLPVDRYGVVDLAALREAIRPDTILVSLMLANNEVGTVEPVREAAAIVHERGVLCHTDAVQAMGKMPVDAYDLGVDLLSLTAHKFGGPKGVGALYVRRGTPLAPLLRGGQQESGLRPGTQNVAGIVALARALDLAVNELPDEARRLANLRDRLQAGIAERFDKVTVNGHPELRLPHILNVSFGGIESEALLLALDVKGIAVSTGSACAAGATEPSHVLRAIGLDPAIARGSLRFSLGHNTAQEDIDYALAALSEIVPALRQVGAGAAGGNPSGAY